MLPEPVDAMAMAPGLRAASAARSRADAATMSGFTTRMVVLRTTSVIGAKSRIGS